MKKFLIVSLLFTGVLFFACDSDIIMPNCNQSTEINAASDLIRSSLDAIDIARGASSAGNSRAMPKFRTVKSINIYNGSKLTDQADTNSVYVVNFTEGGFALIAADKRINPVLGSSDTDEFIVKDSPEHPGAFILELCDDYIPIERDSTFRFPFEPNDPTTPAIIEHGDHNCYVYHSVDTIGDPNAKLIWSIWDQGYPYNYYCPLDQNGQRTLVGCVPVAMGLVMAYHWSPRNYNGYTYDYAAIISQTYYTSATPAALEVARLLHDVGVACNANYGVNATGVPVPNALVAFRNRFGYTSAALDTYAFSTVRQDVTVNRPLIGIGYGPNSGHAWIIDGWHIIRDIYQYVRVDNGQNCQQDHYDYNYVHCNWGWGGICNGNYISGIFTPSGYNFTTNKKLIHNLIPTSY